MKRLIFTMMMGLISCCLSAQETDTYLPFVAKGKTWRLTYNQYEDKDFIISRSRERYWFANDEVVKNGKRYLTLYYFDDNLWTFAPMIAGLFREEDKKVYQYDEETQTETLLYDFSLKVGDTFTYQYDGGSSTKCEVLFEETITLNGHRLRQLTIKIGSYSLYAPLTLIEGIGCLGNPLRAMKFGNNSRVTNLAYVQYGAENQFAFLPVSLIDIWGGWRGEQLVCGEEKEIGPAELSCELVGEPDDAYLHVTGYMPVQCGPNNYIFCKLNDTDDDGVKTVSLEIDKAQPQADCVSLYHVDIYFHNFYYWSVPYVEFNGERYPVANNKNDYRPYVTEGKVWKVGWFPDGMDTAKRLAYYYFDGDTIIKGQTAQKMMCLKLADKDHAFEDGSLAKIEYVGAFYESRRKVWLQMPGENSFSMLYDFGAIPGQTFDLKITSDVWSSHYLCTVVKKGKEDNQYHKGNYMEIGSFWNENSQSYEYGNLWLEGFGGSQLPYYNHPLGNTNLGETIRVMSCYDGDELIYVNSNLIDGISSIDSAIGEGTKRRIDFTHVVKTQPKGPARRATENAEESLAGEYNDLRLEINLGTLQDTYNVLITNSQGTKVYEKQVIAGNTLALNIDISHYSGTDYTLTLDNDYETFTGTFKPSILDNIEDMQNEESVNGKSVIDKLFDLQGRPLSTPPSRGMYIQNGKKVIK